MREWARPERRRRAELPKRRRWTGVWVDDSDSCYRRSSEMNVDVRAPIDELSGVRMVREVDPEDHGWALIKRTSNT